MPMGKLMNLEQVNKLVKCEKNKNWREENKEKYNQYMKSYYHRRKLK